MYRRRRSTIQGSSHPSSRPSPLRPSQAPCLPRAGRASRGHPRIHAAPLLQGSTNQHTLNKGAMRFSAWDRLLLCDRPHGDNNVSRKRAVAHPYGSRRVLSKKKVWAIKRRKRRHKGGAAWPGSRDVPRDVPPTRPPPPRLPPPRSPPLPPLWPALPPLWPPRSAPPSL